MRWILVCASSGAALVGLLGCPLPDQNGGGSSGGTTDAGTLADGAAAPTVTGAGCSVESNTGTTLCAATSKCPDVVVDTQALPTCGFRIVGASVDLVCGCATSICPMGLFTTCAEATKLLASANAQTVCVQLADDRCFETTPTSTSTPTETTTSGSTKNPACDRSCVAECGGGAACASVCNCD